MSNKPVSINLVVLNGEKYIRHCLDAVLSQTYPHELIEFNILDNGSTDKTKEIIKEIRDGEQKTNKFIRFFLLESEKNLGVWPGQEELLRRSSGKYVLGLCVDVILDRNFVKNAVEAMEEDPRIGALQAKIYRFNAPTDLPNFEFQISNSKIIDTCGFQIFKSRRVVNIGHGEKDEGQFNEQKEIFGVEGACPFFLREALESCRIGLSAVSEIFDRDFFWYGDDLDIAWRMRLFGWRQVFDPRIIAWHDRQTTKNAGKNWLDHILRVPIRHQIPIKKRRLDWRNTRFTIIKNDYTINILRDLPFILFREIQVLGYIAVFEPKVLLEIPVFFKLLPRMIRKRRIIINKARIDPDRMHRWFL